MTRSPSRAGVPILDAVEVRTVERLSPTFVRLELGGPALADFGVDGPLWDQRVKLILPAPDGSLPTVDATDPDWYARWAALPAGRRGHLRTYTVRGVRGRGTQTRLVLDLVVHDVATAGPGCRWAASAAIGDRVLLLAPRRGVRFGGVEFAPGPVRSLLLAGDETAMPAIAAILEQLPVDATGRAFLEVAEEADVQDLTAPDGITVTWLPRGVEAHGLLLAQAVLSLFGVEAGEQRPAEGHAARKPAGDGRPELYVWMAGESGMVRALRRHLLRDAGLSRRQVTALGYWRRDGAHRS